MVVIGAPVGAVVGDVDAAEVWDFQTPEDLAVVGVEGHEAIEALVEESAVGGEGGGHAGLSVDAEVGTGSADPLEHKVVGGLGSAEALVGVGGVGGGAVLVGPFSGAGDGVTRGHGAVGKGGASSVGPGETGQLGGRAWQGGAFGADEITDAGSERDFLKIRKMNERDTCSVESFACEFFAEFVDEVEVVVKGGDVELALCREGFREGAI